MLSNADYVRQSLELHLFFARIMKEHSFFLELGFTPKDNKYTQQADNFRTEFDSLLGEVIPLSNGIVSSDVLQSGEVMSPYTIDAEFAASYYTGISIPTELTRSEFGLISADLYETTPLLEEKVHFINQKAISLTANLIQFKSTILSNVLSCKMFTVNYPLLIDHIMREAIFYLQMIQKLQSKQIINMEKEALAQELFWNRIMAEHSKFIRGLLDPTENELIIAANNFGNTFDQLTAKAIEAITSTTPLEKVTNDALIATTQIQDFKTKGTQGLLECKIKSIIIPLLGDHTLREANHYLRLLKAFSS